MAGRQHFTQLTIAIRTPRPYGTVVAQEKTMVTAGRERGHQVCEPLELLLGDHSGFVPVDPVRLRSTSNRAPQIDRPWRFFGTHTELDDLLPFAFQYHPPTTVVAHGAVAFWGWLTLPASQVADQWLQFTSETTPKRGDEQQGR